MLRVRTAREGKENGLRGIEEHAARAVTVQLCLERVSLEKQGRSTPGWSSLNGHHVYFRIYRAPK